MHFHKLISLPPVDLPFISYLCLRFLGLGSPLFLRPLFLLSSQRPWWQKIDNVLSIRLWQLHQCSFLRLWYESDLTRILASDLAGNDSDGRAERDLCPLTSVQTSVDNPSSSFCLNPQTDGGLLAVAAGLLVMRCSFPAPPSQQWPFLHPFESFFVFSYTFCWVNSAVRFKSYLGQKIHRLSPTLLRFSDSALPLLFAFSWQHLLFSQQCLYWGVHPLTGLYPPPVQCCANGFLEINEQNATWQIPEK